jgi:hypothetical protein
MQTVSGTRHESVTSPAAGAGSPDLGADVISSVDAIPTPISALAAINVVEFPGSEIK